MNALPSPQGAPTLLPQRQVPAPARHPALVYLANLRPSGRRTMQASLKMLARSLCGGSIGDCPWHLVRYEHAAALRAVLQARYAPATVNRHLTALRGVVREAWRLGWIDAETYHQVADVQNVKHRTLPAGRMLSREELQALYGAASERDRILLALLAKAGLRRSEASAVMVSDVEEPSPGAARVWVREGKGGAERTVSLAGPDAAAVLLVVARKKHGRLLGLGPTGIYERLRRLIHRAGIQGASPHDLRRSFISHALAAGVDLATVSRMAGHADPRTTARYDRRGEEADADAAARLDTYLGG